MYCKLVKFLDKYDILYKHQYGFRAKHNTIHPIIHLLNKCANATNAQNPESTLIVLCDLSKAFDVIDHKMFLKIAYRYICKRHRKLMCREYFVIC